MVRSIVAVIAGFAATFVLSVAFDLAARAAAPGAFGTDGRHPDAAMAIAGVVYTMVSATAGGYIAALIARRAEVMHALMLGTIGALTTLALIVAAPAAQRTAALVIPAFLVIPATTLGGWVRARARRSG